MRQAAAILCTFLGLVLTVEAGNAVLLKEYTVRIIRGGYELGHRPAFKGEVVSVISSLGTTAQVQTNDGNSLTVALCDLRLLPTPIKPPTSLGIPQVAQSTVQTDLLAVKSDRFTGDRRISLKTPIEVVSHAMGFDFWAHFSEGETAPHSITLYFAQSGGSWRYLNYHPLHLLIDGKRVDLGDLDHQGDVSSYGVLEQMTKAVDVPMFLAIANGRNVEAKLGSTEFVIPYAAREGLRQFAARFLSSQKPSSAPDRIVPSD